MEWQVVLSVGLMRFVWGAILPFLFNLNQIVSSTKGTHADTLI